MKNSASRWLLLEEYITMHGPMNVEMYFIVRVHFVGLLKNKICVAGFIT